MKTTFISTSAISAATRLSSIKLQSKLAEAQKEVTTGRHADVGRGLGYKTGQTVSLRQEHARLQDDHRHATRSCPRACRHPGGAEIHVRRRAAFVGQLIGARNSDSGPAVVQGQAQGRSAVAHRRAEHRARRRPPVRRHQRRREAVGRLLRPPAAGQPAGRGRCLPRPRSASRIDDPAVADITAADMQTFLDSDFADLFEDPAWSTNWSAASDQNVQEPHLDLRADRDLRPTPTTSASASSRAPTRWSPTSASDNLNQGAFEGWSTRPPRSPARRSRTWRTSRRASARRRSASRAPTTACRSRSTS